MKKKQYFLNWCKRVGKDPSTVDYSFFLKVMDWSLSHSFRLCKNVSKQAAR